MLRYVLSVENTYFLSFCICVCLCVHVHATCMCVCLNFNCTIKTIQVLLFCIVGAAKLFNVLGITLIRIGKGFEGRPGVPQAGTKLAIG